MSSQEDIDEEELEDWGDVEGWEEDGIDEDDMEESSTTLKLTRQHSFAVLQSEEVERRFRHRIRELSELLSCPESEAGILLRAFRWNVTKITESYFENPEKVRRDAGLDAVASVKPVTTGTFECPQCYDDVDAKEAFSLSCGHQSCQSCWKDYLSEQVKLGMACVVTTCNYYKCECVVPEEVFCQLLDVALLKKYRRWLVRSYIEGSNNMRWCPGPGCSLAVEYASGGAREIQCLCGFYYCFGCGQASHRPAHCDNARKWRVKSNSEAENATWILANTKTCTRCHVQIEKNQGCNHMTCRNCKHEFCWLCKGEWKDHGSATGGYYRCNRFEDSKAKGHLSDEDKQADFARNELQKYLHYFQRFDNHEKSMNFALKTMQETEKRMKELQDLKGGGFNDVQFLLSAVKTVIECRRLLSWTYCVGYYMEKGLEKDLFEELQENLEKFTEHLHELTEKPLDALCSDGMRSEINNYTRVTEKYRENLMKGIEDGLTSMASVSSSR